MLPAGGGPSIRVQEINKERERTTQTERLATNPISTLFLVGGWRDFLRIARGQNITAGKITHKYLYVGHVPTQVLVLVHDIRRDDAVLMSWVAWRSRKRLESQWRAAVETLSTSRRSVRRRTLSGSRRRRRADLTVSAVVG